MSTLLSHNVIVTYAPATDSIRLAIAGMSRGLDKAIAAFIAAQAVRCTKSALVNRFIGLDQARKPSLRCDASHISSNAPRIGWPTKIAATRQRQDGWSVP